MANDGAKKRRIKSYHWRMKHERSRGWKVVVKDRISAQGRGIQVSSSKKMSQKRLGLEEHMGKAYFVPRSSAKIDPLQ